MNRDGYAVRLGSASTAVVRRHAARVTGVTGLVLLSGAAKVAAQARPDTTRADSARRIDRVTIQGARTPAAVGGSSAVIVRPDSLRTPPAPRLEEALREIPFVLVRQNSRGEMELSVRGSDSRQAAVLLDGVPLTLGWDHRSDPSLIPLSGVQSVVLVRGLSSLLQGPNVLGGVIDLGVGTNATGSVARRQLWAGTGVDQYGGQALSIGGTLPIESGTAGTLTLRGGAGYRFRDGFRVTGEAGDTTSDDELRTNSDLRQYDGFASLRWQGAAGRHVGVTATSYKAERGVPPELHIEAPRLWRYPDQSRLFAALSAGTGAARTPFGTGSMEFVGGYNAGKLEIESFTDRTYTTLDARELGNERTATGRITAAHTLPAGAQLRAAFTGADVRYEETLGDDPASDYRQRLWSTGAEMEWPVRSHMVVGGGVVYDAATTPETGGKESLGRVDAWGWRGGATLVASDAVRMHGSVSRRSRFPSLRELYSGALNRFQPNPALRPEQLTGAELGVTLGTEGGAAAPTLGGLSLQVVGFHHRLEDAVVRTTVPNTRLFVRVNRDEIRSTGAELLGAWHSSANPARAVSLTGDLLAQHVRVRDDSANAERRPEHQPETRGSLEVGVPLPVLVRGFAGVRYTGAQYCVSPDDGNQVRLSGQTEANLALERSWSLGRGTGVFGALRTVLALDNVADATVYDQCGLPQPGRTLRLAIQLR
jgi:iron complex outermembrane receptor protein